MAGTDASQLPESTVFIKIYLIKDYGKISRFRRSSLTIFTVICCKCFVVDIVWNVCSTVNSGYLGHRLNRTKCQDQNKKYP